MQIREAVEALALLAQQGLLTLALVVLAFHLRLQVVRFRAVVVVVVQRLLAQRVLVGLVAAVLEEMVLMAQPEQQTRAAAVAVEQVLI